MTQIDVIIIGAGASGLLAARELSRAGKKVIILEAKDRIGGRIYPLDKSQFGYPAEGGAEFVHGTATITKSLIQEAGLTYQSENGEVWSVVTGTYEKQTDFVPANTEFINKLNALTTDISIGEFLEKNFPNDSDRTFTETVKRRIEAFDAADPKYMSALALRDEWFGHEESADGKIKEGYGALIEFIQEDCMRRGVEFVLSTIVAKILTNQNGVEVTTADGKVYECSQVIVTVPPTVLSKIDLGPEYNWKQELAAKISYGNLVKVLFKFKTRWWEHVTENDLTNMFAMLSNEKFMTWWTQYPDSDLKDSNLVGWVSGPPAAQYIETSDDDLINIAFESLVNIFHIDMEKIKEELIQVKVVNWSADPYAQGGYSYMTVGTHEIRKKLEETIAEKIYFAGEVFSKSNAATVEGAFETAIKVSKSILALK